MQYVEGFPKTMVHPSFAPAIISDAAVGTAQSFAGQPARFLPQMVHTPDEEADMRARGYLDPGEPPAQVHHAEYPKILRHPRYAPAVKESHKSVIVKSTVNGQVQEEVKIVTVPAQEEQFPDKTVATAEEEEHWRGEGWAPAGEWDSAAFERAHSTPEVAYDPQEWPKWVPTGEVDKDGKPIAVLMEDPAALSEAERGRIAHEYPKWVGRRVFMTADEEDIAAQEAATANSGVAVLGLIGSIDAPYVPASTAAPQPGVDVAALKAEIIGELAPQIRDVIREALSPKEVVPHKPEPKLHNAKRTLSEDARKAIGVRLKAARAAKRAKEEGQS